MKPKVANELFSILKLLESEDVESCVLGLTTLLEHPLIKNLSKFYKSDFDSTCHILSNKYLPKHFSNSYSHSNDLKYCCVKNVRVKEHIQNILNFAYNLETESQKSEFFLQLELIYIWICNRLSLKKSNRNYSKEFSNYRFGYSFTRKHYNQLGSISKHRRLLRKIHEHDSVVYKSREKFIKGYKKYQSKKSDPSGIYFVSYPDNHSVCTNKVYYNR